jgi:hypothetical protein
MRSIDTKVRFQLHIGSLQNTLHAYFQLFFSFPNNQMPGSVRLLLLILPARAIILVIF